MKMRGITGSGPTPVLIYTDKIEALHVQRHDPQDPSNPDGVTSCASSMRCTCTPARSRRPAMSTSRRRAVAANASQTTLCRAPAQGVSRCVTVPAITHPPAHEDCPSPVAALVAQDGGVVFVPSGVSLLPLEFSQ